MTDWVRSGATPVPGTPDAVAFNTNIMIDTPADECCRINLVIDNPVIIRIERIIRIAVGKYGLAEQSRDKGCGYNYRLDEISGINHDALSLKRSM